MRRKAVVFGDESGMYHCIVRCVRRAFPEVAILCLLAVLLSSCRLPCPVSPSDATAPDEFPEVRIDGAKLLVGGEEFLVVAIGYEIGARPGRVPWERDFQPELLRADFKRIKEAGFNTLRTWSPMTDEELEMAADYGLWVIQGLWYDPGADFNDPAFRRATLDRVEREVTRSAPHPNILFYLLGNEPHGDAVYRAGIEHVNEFFRELIAAGRRCDPARFFSYSNCVITDFLIPEMWDLAAMNIYPYSPDTIRRALGYRTYLDITRQRMAATKPMVVTEFGLSVSPVGDGRGYGGNSLVEQRDGVIQMWDEILAAGCAGGCAFMWIDGWWKFGDPDVHNDHAEEWYGLLGADQHYVGEPRPVYFALKEYNQAIRIDPAPGAVYTGDIPIRVWAPRAAAVQARLDDGAWLDLKREGRCWWGGSCVHDSLPEGEHVVETRALNSAGEPAGLKQCPVTISRTGARQDIRPRVRFVNLPERVAVREPIVVEVEVADMDGQPVSGQTVRIECFRHTKWYEHGVDVVTDARGRARTVLPPFAQPGIISVAAGTASPDRGTGAYEHVEIK